MKVSPKGWYALQALTLLAHRFDGKSPTKRHDIATADGLPEKFLEFILLGFKHARIEEGARGAKGGYRLKRLPSDIFVGEIIRAIDGPSAPFEDAESLRRGVKQDSKHTALFQILLSVRTAAAGILTAPRLRISAVNPSSGWGDELRLKTTARH
jgi:Rrf2 family protein